MLYFDYTLIFINKHLIFRKTGINKITRKALIIAVVIFSDSTKQLTK